MTLLRTWTRRWRLARLKAFVHIQERGHEKKPQKGRKDVQLFGVSSSVAAPNVPTIAEQTNTNYDLVPWFRLYALSKTPEPALQKLKSSANEAMNDPELIEKLKNLGLEPGGENTRDLNQFAKTEIKKWADIVINSGAKVN
ncbi:tripartite tricarboxylate transporter substrate-binding protein [Advenella sp. RU8]|uniref:tripartite tricarboxylate transporter substrate-binding protein n=1 Tax=Advenella sp. RU8 TaxID=3399575 RepID=UPI003AAC62AD